jgi:phospholipid/cholesterol/gamma-HCH transport system substrate-binding protein
LATQDKSGPSDNELAQALPEQKGSRDASVGVFVILGAITFITLLFLLTDPSWFRGRYMLTTAVEDVAGLRNGDPIQMRGVNIGRVHRSRMIPGEDSVVITLEIEGEWNIPDNSVVELLSGGLLSGGRTVEVRPGTSTNFVRSGGHLPGRIVKGVLENTDVLAARGEELLERLNGLISDSTVASLEGSLSGMQVLIGEFAELAETRGDDIGELITELKNTAEGLGEATGPEFRANLNSTVARADSMMSSMNAASAQLSRVSTSLEVVLARIERGEGTLGQLSVNDTLYVSMTAAVTSLATLLDDLKANPGRYINLSIF